MTKQLYIDLHLYFVVTVVQLSVQKRTKATFENTMTQEKGLITKWFGSCGMPKISTLSMRTQHHVNLHVFEFISFEICAIKTKMYPS